MSIDFGGTTHMEALEALGRVQHVLDAEYDDEETQEYIEGWAEAMYEVSRALEPTVADGFGGEWLKCSKPDCDLQVVRPGKVQCSNSCGRVS